VKVAAGADGALEASADIDALDAYVVALDAPVLPSELSSAALARSSRCFWS